MTPSERAEQEINLYTFFAAFVAGIEALFYGLYAMGSLWDPATFDLLPGRPRDVWPNTVATAYARVTGAGALAAVLDTTLSDNTYREGEEIRNVLSHRAAPGRAIDTLRSPATLKLDPHAGLLPGI
jgi:hypothetical protein